MLLLRNALFLLVFSILTGPVIPEGLAPNADTVAPAVSADGRFVVFESAATDLVPGDRNGQTDVFLYDRQSGETRLVSISPAGVQGDGPSGAPAISGDGRFVAFESDAANLVPGDDNGLRDIFALDRLTGLITRVSVTRVGAAANGASHTAAVDHAGRYFVYVSAASNLVFNDGNQAEDVFIYDRLTQNVIRASAGTTDGGLPAISGDGRIVAFTNTAGELFIYHRVLDTTTKIGESAARPSVSFTGGTIAFINAGGIVSRFSRDTSSSQSVSGSPSGAKAVTLSDDAATLLISAADGLWVTQAGELRIFRDMPVGPIADLSASGTTVVYDALLPEGVWRQVLAEDLADRPTSYHLAGRVTDSLGHPLALVTISDGIGDSTRTDADGYFYLSGYPGRVLTLTPEKEGYAFDPQVWNLSVIRDVAGYLFTASPEEKLLEEAAKDLGMPYDFNRGCDDPYIPCGKPFHGFSAGYCTDLILDAYTYGVEFDINYALQQDAYAHPEHFYRWRDARNAHDMWRYFYYSGQLLDHADDYLPGDSVFFDWSGDGEIDHVSLVSKVVNGRPVKMMDATGVTEQNPTGLAAELDWLNFHESTVRGHGRWLGAYEPVHSGYPPGVRVLQTALSGAGLFMRIVDDHGRAVSFGEGAVPGAAYFDLAYEEAISVFDPSGRYTVEIRVVGGQSSPYIFTVQSLSGGRITGRAEFKGTAGPDEVIRIEWRVSSGEDGELSLLTGSGLRQARIKGALRKPSP